MSTSFFEKYYTDWHEVDEDMRAIIACDGVWNQGTMIGIACRNLHNTPADSGYYVASRLIYLS